MRHMEERADRSAHAVDQANAGIGKRHPSLGGTQHHRLARLRALGLMTSRADVPGDERHGAPGDAVGEGAGALADIGFDRVS